MTKIILFTDVQTPKKRYYMNTLYSVSASEFQLIKYFCNEKKMQEESISIPKINYKTYYEKCPPCIKYYMQRQSVDKTKLTKKIKEAAQL